jgi:aryl-alcohol dehydrogenase-like predicted oxidoreductase
MNKIAIGSAQFGMNYGISSQNIKVDNFSVKEILNLAKNNNIDIIDTASTYGESEKVLGYSGASNFNIITKTRHFSKDLITEIDVNNLTDDFNNSLKALKQNTIYGLLFHNAEDLLKPGSSKLFERMNHLKKQGYIKKIGISVYTSFQINEVLKRYDIDLIQVPINILDRRLIDDGTLKLLAKKRIEIHARSIFLQGLLLMDRDTMPLKFKKWDYLWNIWFEWLNDCKISALQASVGYAVSLPEISKILVGINSKNQLKEILNCTTFKIPDLPKEFYSKDLDLINPANWKNL